MVQGNPDQIEPKEEVSIPNIKNMTIEEAEKILNENGLEAKVNNEVEGLNKSEAMVRSQIPEAGIIAYKGSCVYLEY